MMTDLEAEVELARIKPIMSKLKLFANGLSKGSALRKKINTTFHDPILEVVVKRKLPELPDCATIKDRGVLVFTLRDGSTRTVKRRV